MQSTELSKKDRVAHARRRGCRHDRAFATRLCFVTTQRYHRPVQDYQLEARPGRHRTLVVSEARVILTKKNPRSTPQRSFFCEGEHFFTARSWKIISHILNDR